MDADKKAMILMAEAIYSTIKSSPDGVPSGTLYAMLLSLLPGMTLSKYQFLIDILKDGKMISDTGFLLKAI